MIGAILFIWIAVPAFFITFANLSTDIIKDTCIPWGVYSSYTMEVTLTSVNILIVYVLPMMCMVTCYSRIVYTLRNKVTPLVMIVQYYTARNAVSLYNRLLCTASVHNYVDVWFIH